MHSNVIVLCGLNDNKTPTHSHHELEFWCRLVPWRDVQSTGLCKLYALSMIDSLPMSRARVLVLQLNHSAPSAVQFL